jgi:hypothetical protein
MSDNQTQEIKVIQPKRRSWFGCWGSPDITAVVEPIPVKIDTNLSPRIAEAKIRAIGRSIPKSVDETGSFGF